MRFGFGPSVLLAAAAVAWAADDRPLVEDYVKASISAPPVALDLDAFYKKYADAEGIPIVASEKVPDAALLVARDIVNHMLLKRPELRSELVKRHFRVAVMAQSESQTDLPEHRNDRKPGPNDPRLTTQERANYDRIARMTDKEYWDMRARGMGGNPTSCAEENLLGYPGTRYFGENILVHEFSHAIMDIAIRRADPELHKEIQEAYKDAIAKGLWKGHYGSATSHEYWAEGTQTWFWSNYPFRDGDQTIRSPEDLERYDPRLYALLARVYPDHHIPMDVYHARNLRPGRRRQP